MVRERQLVCEVSEKYDTYLWERHEECLKREEIDLKNDVCEPNTRESKQGHERVYDPDLHYPFLLNIRLF